jgi:beta-galactosidase
MDGRKVILLNFGWRYTANDNYKYAEPSYDDSLWELVDIPHTNRELPLHYFDDRLFCFVSWYRKEIPTIHETQGRRFFLRFEGVSTSATVYAGGVVVGLHEGGFTPFEVELTGHIVPGRPMLVAVRVDSTEQPDVPPFGGVVDYLTYGGIYREVALKSVPPCYIRDVFVQTPNPLDPVKTVVAQIALDRAEIDASEIATSLVYVDVLNDHGSVLTSIGPQAAGERLTFQDSVQDVRLWDLETPVLYTLRVRLMVGNLQVDEVDVRFGFRQAVFTNEGFFLNGRLVKLRGLNRHQSYPYVGYAMPRSQQEADARMLKNELGLQIVRTSHYPQSTAFLNCCDEIGLLVFTEIPGWQHIGKSSHWRELALQSVREMVERDRNHPCVVLWGVRINESPDDDELYTATNKLAKELDPTRQTAGVRNFKGSHLLEDVYTYNDFVHNGTNRPLDTPISVCKSNKHPYLVTEHNGHMFPTKTFDTEDKRLEHALRHARVLDAMYGDKQIAGAIGWCMSDYNTHREFGSGDQICHHGVTDMFRIPKLAASVYASQKDDPPVMNVSSHMAIGEHAAHNIGDVYVFTNCDKVRLLYNGGEVGLFYPNFKRFPHLPHPPVIVDDLIGSRLDAEKEFSSTDRYRLKRVLLSASEHGMNLPVGDKLTMAYLLLRYRLSFADGVRLFERYVGSWDGNERIWTFEGYRGGNLVCSSVFTCAEHPMLSIEADRPTMREGDTYDVLMLIVSARGEHGQLLQFSNDPVLISVEGPIRLMGPSTISLSGGSAGLYIRTCGGTGEAVVHVHSPSLGTCSISIAVD